MLNLALISSAGAYINGTEAFDITSRDGDATFREIPIEVEAADMLYAARGYDPAAVLADRNAQIPVERLLEYEASAVIGRLNNVWWSLNGFIPNAQIVAEQLAPTMKNAALTFSCFKTSRIFGVHSASGPSSKVSAIFPTLSPVRWMTYDDGILS